MSTPTSSCSFIKFGRCNHPTLQLIKCVNHPTGCNNLLHHVCGNEFQQWFYTNKHGHWPPPASADSHPDQINNPYETDVNYCASCQPNKVTPFTNTATASTTVEITTVATPPPLIINLTATTGGEPSSALTTTTSVATILPPLKYIWDCSNINKCKVNKGGVEKDGWKCTWCGLEFAPIHATRAQWHVLKLTNKGIAICRAVIPDNYQQRYQDLWDKSSNKKAAIKRAGETTEDNIVERQQNAVRSREQSTSRSMGGASTSSSTERSMNNHLGFAALPKPNNNHGRNSSLVNAPALINQPSINASITNYSQTDIRKSNNAQLQMAIADLWHCENFPDSAVESVRFKLVIQYARLCGSDFKIPNRKSIGGPLLTLNYQNCYQLNKEALLREVSSFVLYVFSFVLVDCSHSPFWIPTHTHSNLGGDIWFDISRRWCNNQTNASV